MNRISKNIRFLRKKTDLNQAQLADQLGFKRSTYATFESGRAKLTLENIVKISNYFRISVDDIIKNDLSNLHIKDFSKGNNLAKIQEENSDTRKKNITNKYPDRTRGLGTQNDSFSNCEDDSQRLSRLDLEQVREELEKLKKAFKESLQLIEQKNMEHALFGVLEALDSERKYSACLEEKIKQLEARLLKHSENEKK
jgi:transcriptional regulator with XRE-family HTH domain